MRLACEAANVGRSTHYGWLERDPNYRAAFALEKEVAADILEAEAHRRAVEGVEKPVGWYKGKPGGYVREYSDVLLIFLLKALRPEQYKDRVEFKGIFANLDYSQIPDALIQRLADGENPVSVLGTWLGEQRTAKGLLGPAVLRTKEPTNQPNDRPANPPGADGRSDRG